MSDYYWNSAFTIAAADFPDSSHGLFPKRDAAALYPCITTLQVTRGPGVVAGAPRPVSIAPRIEFTSLSRPFSSSRPYYSNVLEQRG